MLVEVDIQFEELVKIAKKLPAKQWTKLKVAVDSVRQQHSAISDLETLL